MNRWIRLLPLLCVAAAVDAAGESPAGADDGMGALLYSTHCVACHTTQVHWRDGKQVTNYPALLAQVRRWQASIGLGFSDDEIAAVARHLNALYYHFPEPGRAAMHLHSPG